MEIMDYVANFRKNLREMRNKTGLSQTGLASELNIGDGMIFLYESTTVIPNTYNLLVIAEYFGVGLDELLGREIK